jgi:hypothetical protein
MSLESEIMQLTRAFVGYPIVLLQYHPDEIFGLAARCGCTKMARLRRAGPGGVDLILTAHRHGHTPMIAADFGSLLSADEGSKGFVEDFLKGEMGGRVR